MRNQTHKLLAFTWSKEFEQKLRASPFKWIGKKVKAHQDDEKAYEELNSWEKANVAANEITKENWT